ncbi:MAG: ABC transporter substrate-binding protein [Pseudomonadaceae bacterium]|nr:ABC transporter substrate-binding protein [Pseudomonadaceae bacterium]
MVAASLPSSFAAAPAEPKQTSWQVVEQGLADLTKVFEANKGVYETNPQALYDKLDLAMQPYVDFRYISARVMGGRYFRAATPEQRSRFAATFQTTLVRTFGQGLMSFDYREFDLSIQEGETRFEDQDKVALEVIAKDGQRYPLSFTLRLHNNEWKVINLIVNGINLGLTFNSQFDRAMRENNRDFDAVITHWSPEQALNELQEGEVK